MNDEALGGRTWFDRVFPDQPDPKLGDFTTTRRMLPVALLAAAIGVVSGYVALALLELIGLFTNLFFYGRLKTSLVSPADHQLGFWVVLVPVTGALLIGLMARYGSERIRGHGIPEALEAILIRGSRVEPRLAVLKPLSAAISIGSGGPFGAEGPIIMTGGAFGSLIAQGFHLTSAERKTLLVAGATGGMTATFGSPMAAVLLAVELLLFELKPRSFVPVALSCAAAMATRHFLMPAGPLFHVPPHASFVGVPALLGCAVAGVGAGALSALMTGSVYLFEDLFQKHMRRIHWMWWPALAGVVIGIGGLICPQALGVGYDSIAGLLSGQITLRAALLLFAVKWAIWSFALGSGTSGGVLAPLLIMGAALGTLETEMLPAVGPGFWPLVSMGAILGGTMRSPLTGILFAVEITHDWDALLPLSIAVAVAHAFTVLALRRSILTEKVSRRGYHVSREYAIDPLEVLFVREVMRPPPAATALSTAASSYPDETLRAVVYRMATQGVTELPVVTRNAPREPIGVISLQDLLQARKRHLEEETRRERVFPVRLGLPGWLRNGGK
jgi:chloride channel protein, CIC family